MAADQAALTAGNAAALADGTVQTVNATQAAPAAQAAQAPQTAPNGAPITASQATTVNPATNPSLLESVGNLAGALAENTTAADLHKAGSLAMSLYGGKQQTDALDALKDQVNGANNAVASLVAPVAPPTSTTPTAITPLMAQAQQAGVPISQILKRRNQQGFGANSTALTGPNGVMGPINVRANTLLGI